MGLTLSAAGVRLTTALESKAEFTILHVNDNINGDERPVADVQLASEAAPFL